MTIDFVPTVTAGAITREAVQQLLEEYRSAYDRSDQAYFDLFASDATFFILSSPTRIDSREEFQRVFTLAAGTARRSQLLSPEIRILGDTALVSLHCRVALGEEQQYLRETLVVTRGARGDLRIAHLHVSPQDMPSVPDSPERAVEEISVIEERTATTASTVGTPK
ncbi:nuclear transport factor 2 family protein [Streptomyces roseifaciens]